MTTTTSTSETVNDLTAGFDKAADQVRAVNDKLIETAKKNGNSSLDAYEKTVTTLVDFQRQVGDATQIDWVSTAVKAQTDFFSELSSAYTAAAREALK